MNRLWAGRTGRILIIVASAVVFALVGLLWIHMTGLWGSGVPRCTGPPGLVACTNSPPASWGWRIFGMALGASFGFILAVATLKVAEVSESRKQRV